MAHLADITVSSYTNCGSVREVDMSMLSGELGEDLLDCAGVVDGDVVSVGTNHSKFRDRVTFRKTGMLCELGLFQGDSKDSIGSQEKQYSCKQHDLIERGEEHHPCEFWRNVRYCKWCRERRNMLLCVIEEGITGERIEVGCHFKVGR